MSKFQKATKTQSKLRLALFGPSGSGKTYSSLALAKELVPGGRIAVIDTERGSASKYADEFEFDVLELESYGPDKYVQAIKAAQEEGYDVIVIDSLTHAWAGKGGALEQADNASQFKGENRFTAWRHVTPKHNELVDAILTSKCHVIVTMRSKTEWVIEEDEKGRKVPKKKGTAPIQRDGMEYEFDVVGSMNLEGNVCIIDKSRCRPLAEQQYFPKPGKEMAKTLREWLTTGAPAKPAAPAVDWSAKLQEGLLYIGQAPIEMMEELKTYLKENFPKGECPDNVRKQLADALVAKGKATA